MRPLFLVMLTFSSACRCAAEPEARLFTQFREAPQGRVLDAKAEAATRRAYEHMGVNPTRPPHGTPPQGTLFE